MDSCVATGLTFHGERFATLWPEAEALVAANFEEMRRKPGDPFAPRLNVYAALEAQNLLRVYAARVDGELVGYRVLVLNLHSHRSQLVARNEALYVAPQHRARVAWMLMRWSEHQLRDEGVVEVYQSHKPDIVDLSRFLTALAYEPVEVTYSKRL